MGSASAFAMGRTNGASGGHGGYGKNPVTVFERSYEYLLGRGEISNVRCSNIARILGMSKKVIKLETANWKPISVVSELFEVANNDCSGFKVALDELGIMGDLGGWKEAELHDRIIAAEAAAALAKAGDGSRLPMLFMLLEEGSAECRKEAFRMAKWVGEELGYAEKEAKRAGFLKIWDIAKTSGDPSEKNLAIDCLAYFREFISEDMVFSASQDYIESEERASRLRLLAYIESGDRTSGRQLACAAQKLEDLAPLLEPLEKYSSKKSLSSILWTALSLSWTLPFVTVLADCVLRLETGRSVPPQRILWFVGGGALLGGSLLPISLRRWQLREKCQRALNALHNVQDAALASEVLTRVKKCLSFPNEPSSNPLWNALLAVVALPNTLMLFNGSTWRLCATSAIRASLLNLADAYAKKFASCRMPATELMQHMADIIRKPFFRLWSRIAEFPLLILVCFTAPGPHSEVVERLKKLGIEI